MTSKKVGREADSVSSLCVGQTHLIAVARRLDGERFTGGETDTTAVGEGCAARSSPFGQIAPANEDIRASHDACPGDGISGYDGPSQDLEIARR